MKTLLVARKVNKVEESFLWLIQAMRVDCVKGEKTQFDSLQFQLSTLHKENKENEKEEMKKEDKKG